MLVVATGGLSVGRRWPVRRRDVVIGRGAGCDVRLDDPSVSRRHAAIDLAARTVTDLASRAGTFVDGRRLQPGHRVALAHRARIRVGTTTLAVEPGHDRAHPRPGPFHRPPRPPSVAPTPPVPEPAPPDPPPEVAPVGVVGIVAPLGMAALMVVVMGSLAFALFALLSPVLAIGGAVEQRRRRTTTMRRLAAEHARAVAAASAARAAAAARERARLDALHPGVATALRWARSTSSRLWEARPDDAARLVVRLGSGPVTWVAQGSELADAAVTVDLAAGPVGIAGPRAAALAVARALVLQAVVRNGPADLRIGRADTDEAWAWLESLPHVRAPGDGATELVVGRDVIVAPSVRRLPATCTTVVPLDASGRRTGAVIVDGVDEPTAADAARCLAPVIDPEAAGAGALPEQVSLLPSELDVAASWAAPTWRTPIGAGPDGVVSIDLVADGPHGLVAGTTGSGKSELLRSLVAGLAHAASPERTTFLLIDFKGGSAFDACARLPHTIGVVTDLDAATAARALRCLEAEVRHRERVLREAGATDLAAYAGSDPLPRLVVVVDEFATLKGEVPGFVEALVGIAQRGRSLGLHLVLATQRPAGVVSDHIRANTDVRIALRVQDPADSVDVVGTADAAALPRARPGRALLRVGGGPVVPFQASLASDLARLVDACATAWAGPPPRRPWLDPLPLRLGFDGGGVGVVDDPDHQRRLPLAWAPSTGHLAVVGGRGSGTTTTLVAVGVALAAASPPDALHLYGIDHGAGDLGVLAGLPHSGAIVAGADLDRRHRLLRHLVTEVRRRQRGRDGDEPAVVLLVDGMDESIEDALAVVAASGAEVGVHLAFAADRWGAIPSAVAAGVRHRWTHRLDDQFAEAAVRGLPPGRLVVGASGLVAQVAMADDWREAVAEVSARWRPVASGPWPVPALADRIELATLAAAAHVGLDRPWLLPIGVAHDDLRVVGLPFWEGGHALVAGPPRSGRTTALATLATAACGHLRVVAVAGRRSWLGEVPGIESGLGSLSAGPALVLVDDAEAVDDDALGRLVADPPDGVHVVAAGRTDALRSLYGHWTRVVRAGRTGLLLRPQADLDGDLLGVVLPRHAPPASGPGRGYLVVDGTAVAVQVAVAP